MLLVDIYYGFGAMLHENFSVAIFYWTSRDFRNLRNLLQKGCGSFPSCHLCHALVSGGTWASWMWDSSKRDVSVACAKHLLEAMRGISISSYVGGHVYIVECEFGVLVCGICNNK